MSECKAPEVSDEEKRQCREQKSAYDITGLFSVKNLE